MRRIVKSIVYGIAWFFSLFFNNFVIKGGRYFCRTVATANFRRKLGKHGKRTLIGLRNEFYGLKAVSIGDDFQAGDGFWMTTFERGGSEPFHPSIKIGNHVSISRNGHISAIENIEIEDNVLIGSNVLIEDHSHGPSVASDTPRTDQPLISKDGGIIIRKNVWIGDNVCIFSVSGGVEIGRNSIIGANSVVTRSFPQEGVVIAGVPARIVKVMEKGDTPAIHVKK